jgi:predicted AAA+ superfamily ATPase
MSSSDTRAPAELFPQYELPRALLEDLRRQNPWWDAKPLPDLPAFRRWPFARIRERLERPVAPILVLRGPRQIGKTTIQHQIIDELLRKGVPPERILRVQFDELPALRRVPERDEPILRIVDWFERAILGRHLNEAARAGEPALMFFDEVQNLASWHAQLKSLVDHASVRALVTGSSALRIERGRDSLAGRIQTLEIGPLRLTEIAALRGFGELPPLQAENGWGEWLEPSFWRSLRDHGNAMKRTRDLAFRAFSDRGAYPFTQITEDVAWPEVSEYLIETVVRRVIQHDLRMGDRGRKRDEQLLEEVFRLACRYVGQSPEPKTLSDEVERTLGSKSGPQRILNYLRFLDSTLLLRLVGPHEIRLKKKRGNDKIVLSDHAIRAAWLQEQVPLVPEELDSSPQRSGIAGHIVEGVVGYYLESLNGPGISYWPGRSDSDEVDFIMTIGDRRIPVEVKYQRRLRAEDTLGLRQFVENPHNSAPFGLLVTRDDETTVDDPRIISIPLRSFLLVR